jgi:hypothetical protein
LKSADSASYRLKMEARMRLLDACSNYDYMTTWKQARKRGNPKWFTRSTKYQEWRKRQSSGTLSLTGNLGSGKTIIMASMIDDLNLFVHKGIVAYFFCRHDISESLKARTVIGCLAKQLLQQSGNIDKLNEEVGEDLSTIDSDKMFQLLEHVFSGMSTVHYFILDGADECEEGERRHLMRLLWRLQTKFKLLLCISSRTGAKTTWITYDEVRFEDVHSGIIAHPSIAIPVNNPDIGDFIEAELEARLELGKLSIGNAAIILEIQDALQAGAEGM